MVDRNRCSLSHLPRSDNPAQNICRSDSERGPCKQTWRKRSQQRQSSTSSESNVHSRQNDFMKGLKIGPNGGDAPEASQTLDEDSSNRPTVCIEALTEKERNYKI